METNVPTTELQLFRNSISKEQGLSGCPMDDEFLMKFLRAKDNKIEPALVVLKKYLKLRRRMKTYNPESVREPLENGMFTVLKNRDPLGRKVLIQRVAEWNTERVSSNQMLVALFLCMEQMICSVETQKNGIVYIGHTGGLLFSHCTSLGVGVMAEFIKVFQGGFPIRTKMLHVIHQPKIFKIVYSITYPLLSNKLKERLHIHGEDIEAMHKFLPREILPESLGGTLTDDLAIDHEFMQELFSREEYLKHTTELISTYD